MDELEAGLGLDAICPRHADPGPALPHRRTFRGEVRGGSGEILLGRVNSGIMLLLVVVVCSTYSGLEEGDGRAFRSYPLSTLPFIQFLCKLLINPLEPLNRHTRKCFLILALT